VQKNKKKRGKILLAKQIFIIMQSNLLAQNFKPNFIEISIGCGLCIIIILNILVYFLLIR
jgi:hypothetical protein